MNTPELLDKVLKMDVGAIHLPDIAFREYQPGLRKGVLIHPLFDNTKDDPAGSDAALIRGNSAHLLVDGPDAHKRALAEAEKPSNDGDRAFDVQSDTSSADFLVSKLQIRNGQITSSTGTVEDDGGAMSWREIAVSP